MSYKGQGAAKLASVPLGNQQEKPKEDPKIVELRRQIARLERSAKELQNQIIDAHRRLEDAEDEGCLLDDQIEELETFFSDYGMHWVGGPPPVNQEFIHGPPDMDIFLQKVKDLNHSVKSQKVELNSDHGVCKLAHDDGAIRLYTQPINVSFLKDILDGFFPTEFKEKYPDGVKLIIDDRRDLFKGEARKLSDSARRGKLIAAPHIMTSQEIGEGDGRIRLRFGRGDELTIKTTHDQTISSIKALLKEKFEIANCILHLTTSLEPLEDSLTIEKAGLYPRGILIVSTQ